MKVVEFKNGKFGIMKRSVIDRILKREGVFYDFFPLGNVGWRSSRDKFFKHCQVDTIEEAEIKLSEMNRKAVKRIVVRDESKN